MKARYAYIPALVFLLALCICAAGAVFYFSAKELRNMKGKGATKQNYQEALQRLLNEQRELENSQNDDKLYGGYFRIWESKERIESSTQLVEKLEKLAEASGVVVVIKEENESGAPAGRTPTQPTRNPRAGLRRPGMDNNGMPGMPTRPGGPEMPGNMGNPGNPMATGASVITKELSVVGSFPRLLEWLGAAEGELSSLRVTKTKWMAKSVEEVELSVTMEYRPIRKDTK